MSGRQQRMRFRSFVRGRAIRRVPAGHSSTMRRARLRAGYRVISLLSALRHRQHREDRPNRGHVPPGTAPSPPDCPLPADAALQLPVRDLRRGAAGDHVRLFANFAYTPVLAFRQDPAGPSPACSVASAGAWPPRGKPCFVMALEPACYPFTWLIEHGDGHILGRRGKDSRGPGMPVFSFAVGVEDGNDPCVLCSLRGRASSSVWCPPVPPARSISSTRCSASETTSTRWPH
jgi:hypothetical protein